MDNRGATERLAEFVVHARYEDLPPEATQAAKLMFLDTLGCGIAGSIIAAKEVTPVLKVLESMGGKEECTLLGSDKRDSWFNAIIINGTFMHSIDYDDTRPSLSTHIGAVLVPSILAVGERVSATGKDAILAAVLGYEAVSRIASSIMPSHYHFWHSTGTNGTFGGAVAAGKLLGFDTDEMELALGIAADQASGLISCIEFGDLTKSLHAGLTSAKGVLAAMLVKNGATGPRGILEYPKGYCNAYSREPKLEKIINGLGDSFDIVHNAPKYYPTIIGSHCAIAATLKLVKEHDIAAAEVLRVDMTTYKTNATNPHPETVLAARLSTPYCIAVAILDREVGMKQFGQERLQDSRIEELIGKIHIHMDPDLDNLKKREMGIYPTKIKLTTNDGRVFSAEEYYPKGVPKNPTSREELEEKFASLCSYVFNKVRMKELRDAILHMESLDDIAQLTRLLVNLHILGSQKG
jgi:2-methylcitrate dehydratase PrpD